jgi:hypothetical protein
MSIYKKVMGSSILIKSVTISIIKKTLKFEMVYFILIDTYMYYMHIYVSYFRYYPKEYYL